MRRGPVVKVVRGTRGSVLEVPSLRNPRAMRTGARAAFQAWVGGPIVRGYARSVAGVGHGYQRCWFAQSGVCPIRRVRHCRDGVAIAAFLGMGRR
jgi:hypothetical protein